MKRSLMRNLNIITRCATLYRDEALRDCGVTGYQTPYFPEICRNPGISQDQLAQSLHVNKSSVTRQLALLEENGFITRQRNESDRRAIEVYPTEKMLLTLPVVRESFKSWHEMITVGLTEEELHTLEDLAERLAQRAEVIG